ncbi:hypothetical protein [Actinokineospora sp. NBRC 105648]|uniref:hypothetical protein n=1 Tax=Actinokineospora sp. NBRC 105648 TaxID=3032206 RepID=UPI0024A5067F|nr:hypothetical protein [Actinokineospora sp. NBRC 105648]GLZ39979.1 hypothetical protein Acsp05_36030 [Actinokineospora sp. NBRC 105648]
MPTPPSRRRPAGPTGRRPKVAGLRKPTGAPQPPEADQDTLDAQDAQDTVDAQSPGPAAPAPEPPAPSTPVPAAQVPGTPKTPVSPRAKPAPAPAPESPDESTPADTGITASGVIGALSTADSDDTGTRRPAPAPAAPADRDPELDEDPELDDDRELDEDYELDSDQEPASAVRRPAGKRRSTGAAVPTTAATMVSDDRPPRYQPAAGRPAKQRWPSWVGIAVPVALIVVLTGAGLWFKGEADSLTAAADSTNRAITDPAATSEVIGKLTVAVERTLSYSYTDLDANAKAVKETLAGTAVCEYDKLFGQLKQLAPAQKLVLTTKVRQIGVQRLEADKADLLVFVDQSTTRADQDQTSASGAQFGIRAERSGGVWKITDFDMFNQPLPSGDAPAQC